jgi:hypothetical protein
MPIVWIPYLTSPTGIRKRVLTGRSSAVGCPGSSAYNSKEYLAENEQLNALYENVFHPASFSSPGPYIRVA